MMEFKDYKDSAVYTLLTPHSVSAHHSTCTLPVAKTTDYGASNVHCLPHVNVLGLWSSELSKAINPSCAVDSHVPSCTSLPVGLTPLLFNAHKLTQAPQDQYSFCCLWAHIKAVACPCTNSTSSLWVPLLSFCFFFHFKITSRSSRMPPLAKHISPPLY